MIIAAFTGVAAAFAPSPATAACTGNFDAPRLTSVSGRIAQIVFDDQCRHVYVANSEQERVEIYAVSTGELEGVIPLGDPIRTIEVTPDGTKLYAGLKGTVPLYQQADPRPHVIVADIAQRKVTGSIRSPDNTLEPSHIIATPYGGLVFMTRSIYGGNAGPVFTWRPGEAEAAAAWSNGPMPAATTLARNADRTVITADIITGVKKYNLATGFWDDLPVPADLAIQRELQSKGAIDSGANGLGSVVYATAPGTSLGVVDVARRTVTRSLDLGDTVTAPAGRVAVSPDATLIAVTTDVGFSIVRANAKDGGAVSLIANSTAFPGPQSFLRFFNGGTRPGAVTVTLADPDDGRILATWTSPSIPAKAAPQYGIDFIEAETGMPESKPQRYLVTATPSFGGTFSHVVWRPHEAITNVSACAPAVARLPLATNVHTSYIDEGYQSYLNIVNTSGLPAAPYLTVYNATTGAKDSDLKPLARIQLPPIPGGTGRFYMVRDLERLFNFKPAGYLTHYVFELTRPPAPQYPPRREDWFLPYPGYLQHFVDNRNGGIWADMTDTCPLPEPFPLSLSGSSP